MRTSRTLGLAFVVALPATACFTGTQAEGLPCRTDDQCGTKLKCVIPPGEVEGVCGGGTGNAPTTTEGSSTGGDSTSNPVVTDGSSGDDSIGTTGDDPPGSTGSTGDPPQACGGPQPAYCQGVPPLASRSFDMLMFEDPDSRGNMAPAIGYFVGDDEWEDIAVANIITSEVVLYQNQGGTGFARLPDPFLTVTSPYDMVTADFDCDGASDLAVASLEVDQMALAYGAGSTLGPFDLANALATPNAWSMAVADFDPSYEGADILVACDSPSLLFVNEGNREFDSPLNIVSGSTPWSVGVGDLDDDGIPDAIIANTQQYDFLDGGGNDYVTVALSSNGFAGQSYFDPDFVNPIDAAAIELDGNPGLDMVVLSKHVETDFTTTTLPGTLTFHANDGSGNFSPIPSEITVDVGANNLAVADFDCDGNDDIAVGHDASAVTWILWGPDHLLATHTEVAQGVRLGSRMEVGDLDHDGYPDLVIPDYGETDTGGMVIEDTGIAVLWGTGS